MKRTFKVTIIPEFNLHNFVEVINEESEFFGRKGFIDTISYGHLSRKYMYGIEIPKRGLEPFFADELTIFTGAL